LIKCYFKNLWDTITNIFIILIAIAYLMLILLSATVVVLSVFKIGNIPTWGWIMTASCLPIIALAKTIDEYL